MTRRPLLVATFLAAYLLSYFFRSTNAVLADDLQRDAGLGPEQLGFMTSLFFLAFAAAQLPLGAALDRWGPRWVPAGLMLAAAAGSLLTASADGFVTLAIGRALIGVGMAGVLMGALKAFSAWFAPRRFATVSGVFVGLGSLGALGATTPLAVLADAIGWRGVFVAAGLATERGPRTLLVSHIEPDDVVALFDLRSALDEQAARLAARRCASEGAAGSGTSARFAALAQRFGAVDTATLAADDPQRHGYYALVAEFDDALDESLASSPYLASAIASTRVHLARVRRLARDDDRRLAQSAAEHAAIARAIAEGDPERAAAATRLHLHEALTSIHAHLPRSGENRPKEDR